MTIARTTFLARLSILSGAAALALSSGPVAADVKTGVDAWSQGDFNRAVGEWQLPAQNGDADAIFNLAQAYRLGRGVPTDIGRAKQLYAEAAKKGHVKAADNYGLLLFQQGEQRNAMPLIKAAADRGDPRAQYILGLSHFNADYAPKDWVRAYALLTLAQSAGLPQAQSALAQMDQYIPMEQRQQAQLVAREIEAEAGRRRAAELAALDLGQRSPALASSSTSASGSVAGQSAGSARITAPRPVAGIPYPVDHSPGPALVAAANPPKQQSDPARAAQTAPRAAQPAARGGSWKVQLGAFGVRANADRLWAKLSGYSALSGTTKVLVSAGSVTRLQAKGFNSRAEAEAACASLKSQGQACMVTGS